MSSNTLGIVPDIWVSSAAGGVWLQVPFSNVSDRPCSQESPKPSFSWCSFLRIHADLFPLLGWVLLKFIVLYREFIKYLLRWMHLKLLLCCLGIQCPQFQHSVSIWNDERKVRDSRAVEITILMVKSTGFGGLVDKWPLLSLGRLLDSLKHTYKTKIIPPFSQKSMRIKWMT